MKEKVFLKHRFELIVCISSIVISFAILITGIILTINNQDLYVLIVFGTLLLLLSIYMLFHDKRVLSKLIFSEKGIEWKWLGKRVLFLDWYNITDITSTPIGKGTFDFTIVSNERYINISITKKMYKTIMQICPNPYIKHLIDSLKYFEWLRY